MFYFESTIFPLYPLPRRREAAAGAAGAAATYFTS